MKWLAYFAFALGMPLVAETQESELFTNVYTVPEAFLSDHGEGKSAKSGRPDLYAAQRILEREGIRFEGDAMATFRKVDSTLVVRNVLSQQALTEAFLKRIRGEGARMIHLTVFEVVNDSDGFDVEPDLTAYNYLKPEDYNGQGAAVTGVFGDPQFQLLLGALREKEGVNVFDRASVVCRSKQSAVFGFEDERLGIYPVMMGDDLTVELAIQFPLKKGEVTALEGVQSAHRLTISDGQVVAYSMRGEAGKMRTFFIKNQFVDPAGRPLNQKDK